ncbi:NAD(P)-binding protein [Trametes punicea]|nr:NAD(P)-binding protein [Trametes punicea]
MQFLPASLQRNLAVLAQCFPPKSKFSVDQIPDLTGRIVIVTGGNVGIGFETIRPLLKRNAKVYMASRSREKAEAAIASLKKDTGREAIFLELDLASMASVRRAAKEFLSQERELHMLFNNAGIMWPPMEETSKDGYDLQFGTNVIGHFYFTELLMPALLAGVASSPDHHTRVITTASSGAYFETIHWDTLKDGPARRKLGIKSLYFQTKFANVVVAHQLAKRYAEKGIISISVNPGNIRTELQRYVPSIARAIMNAVLLYPAPYGALSQLFAGTMPEALNYNGEFLIPWARLGKCRSEAYDQEIGDRLWKWLEEQVKAFEASHPNY